MANQQTVFLNGKTLTIEDIIKVAEKKHPVAFAKGIESAIKEKRKGLDEQLTKKPEIKIYGTNVGCGDLKDTDITPESFEDYQQRYVKAHNCGTGEPLPEKIVRAIMVIRLNSFAKNLSAMRWETCERMIEMLNKDLTPEILEEGSVGASGDLVPLAMMAAVLIGLPQAWAYYKGKRMLAPQALKSAGIKATKLGAKEAMGLTNGSNFIAAFGVFAVRDAERLINNASISAALSLEAIRGEQDAFSKLINDNRPHKGQKKIAAQIRNLINGTKRATAKAQLVKFPNQYEESVKVRVQDRYSFRAVPQVHGAASDAVRRLREDITTEINSATDNPLFSVSSTNFFRAFSGANFHGQPLATVIDYAKLSITGLSLVTDKRTFSLLDKHLNFGLPGDLATDASKGDTGLMITQYAGAARAAENRVLSTPSSVMSISTAANQEDFVSMGSIGVVHLAKVIRNTQIVIAIEMLCALRGLQISYNFLPENLRPLGAGTKKVYEFLNKKENLPPVSGDTYLRTEMEKMIELVKEGKLVELVEDLLK
jgi:histidine ammonia-lyase